MIKETVTKDMHDENQKPDYSFIMNQPGFEPTPPKRRPKGIMFVAVIVALMGVITVLGLFARRSQNVAQVDTTTGKQESGQFLQMLATEKADEAYNMYEKNYRPDKDVYSSFANGSAKRLDLKNCTLREDQTKATIDNTMVVYRCNYLDKPSTSYIDFGFLYQRINGQKQLTHMQALEIKV